MNFVILIPETIREKKNGLATFILCILLSPFSLFIFILGLLNEYVFKWTKIKKQ